MTWARFDDRYDDNRKVKRAWRRNPRAVGLHAMAITYSARHHTDGLIDSEWIEEKVPRKRDRDQCVATLVAVGLLERIGDDVFCIHDFLDYNESRQDRATARAEERQRKAAAGRKGGLAKAANARKQAESENGSASSDLAPASDLPAEGSSSPADPSVARTAPHRTNPPNPQGGIDGKELDDAKERIRGERVQRVFDAWVEAAEKDAARTVLDDKRKRLIRKALERYPIDDVVDAVRGWRHSPHHRGENERHTVYNDLGLLLRDTEHIERFRDLERQAGPGSQIDRVLAAAKRREALTS